MSGETTGGVRWVLRIEGFFVLLAALFFYSKLAFGWGTFALFFLVPDISFLGYLAGSRLGAFSYNFAHSYVGPIVCALTGIFFNSSILICVSTIWFAHIGFDRALGYGLKYSKGFHYTHLGVIGRLAKSFK